MGSVWFTADLQWILGDFCWGGIERARHYLGCIRCRNVNLVWATTIIAPCGPFQPQLLRNSN